MKNAKDNSKVSKDHVFWIWQVLKLISYKPGIIFKSNLAYKFPYNQEKLGIRIEVSDSLSNFLAEEIRKSIPKKFSIKESETIETEPGVKFKLLGFNKNPKAINYQPEDGDIAVASIIEFSYNGIKSELQPIYLIRNQHEIVLPCQSFANGISIRFNHINPGSSTMDFEYSRFDMPQEIPVRIAENVPRTDYIVMEIIEFPGINLVWIGSLLMVFGLAYGSYKRTK